MKTIYSVVLAVFSITILGFGQNASDQRAQDAFNAQMKNAKEVSAQKAAEKEKERASKEIPDVHSGRLKIGEGKSLGGSVVKGGGSVNIRVSEPVKPAPAAPKSTPPAAAPAAPAPTAPTRSGGGRDFMDHTRPSVIDSRGGPMEGGKSSSKS